MTKETETPQPVKRIQVSATVDPEVATALDDIFYDARGTYTKRSDVVRAAIHKFVTDHGKL